MKRENLVCSLGVAFITFILLQSYHVNGEVLLTEEYNDVIFTMSSAGLQDVENITFTLPNGTEYLFNSSSLNMDPFKADLRVPSVTLISASRDYQGIYNMLIMKDNEEAEEEFSLYFKVSGTPKVPIDIVEEEYVYLRIDEPLSDDRNCSVVLPNGTILPVEQSSLFKPLEKGMCGVQFKMDLFSTPMQTWKLLGNNDTEYIFTVFSIRFLDKNSTIIKDKTRILLDRRVQLIDFSLFGTTGCTLHLPTNQTISIDGTCRDTILATKAHQGIWTVNYILNGKMEVLSEEFQVNVKTAPENSEVFWSVTSSNVVDKGLDIECYVDGGTASNCLFTRPDGLQLYPQIGIGTARYSYFKDMTRTAQCGITIHAVSEEDKGLWQCAFFLTVKYENGTDADVPKASSKMINTETKGIFNKNRAYPLPNYNHELKKEQTIYVKNSTEFTLTFKAKNPISYCWFRRPNGDDIPFSNVLFEHENIKYEYQTSYFAFGICTLFIHMATEEDTGEWSCHMGSSDIEDGEIQISFSVKTVVDGIFCGEEKVKASTKDEVKLSCHSVPADLPIEYCRFARPDGKGFSSLEKSSSSNYEWGSKDDLRKGVCQLTIKSLADVDVGEWGAAMVPEKEAELKEASTTFTVTEDGLSTGAISGIVIGVIAVVAVIGGFAYYMVRRNK